MKTWWRIRLCFWLARYGYAEWWQVRYLWRWSLEECWQMYHDEGEAPRKAVLEDLSYA